MGEKEFRYKGRIISLYEEKVHLPNGNDNYIKKLEKQTGRILQRQKPGPKPRIK